MVKVRWAIWRQKNVSLRWWPEVNPPRKQRSFVGLRWWSRTLCRLGHTKDHLLHLHHLWRSLLGDRHLKCPRYGPLLMRSGHLGEVTHLTTPIHLSLTPTKDVRSRWRTLNQWKWQTFWRTGNLWWTGSSLTACHPATTSRLWTYVGVFRAMVVSRSRRPPCSSCDRIPPVPRMLRGSWRLQWLSFPELRLPRLPYTRAQPSAWWDLPHTHPSHPRCLWYQHRLLNLPPSPPTTTHLQ